MSQLPRHLAQLEEATRRCTQGCADIDESLGLIHELLSDTTAARAAWKRFCASQKLATGLLDYNYNLLQSVDDEGVLFTFGDNDTMPAWLLQRVHGVRGDVTIMNLSIAHAQRPLLVSQLSRMGIGATVESLAPASQDLVHDLATRISATGRRVFVALTVPATDRQRIEDQLKLCGLAARYDPGDSVDAGAALHHNFSQRFRLDGLRHDWYDEMHPSLRPIVRRLNTHYGYGLLALATSHPHQSQWPDLSRRPADTSGDSHFSELIRQRLQPLKSEVNRPLGAD